MDIDQAQVLMLRDIIIERVLHLIDDDYILLDAPNYSNIGDSLIYEGEKEFLKLCPYEQLYAASNKFTKLKNIPDRGIILLSGGGNFGDLWPSFQKFRSKIISHFKDRKIIIFPQSIFYEHSENLKRDAEIFNAHPNLTICARDIASYHLLQQHFPNNHIDLVPDMAFCLDLYRFIAKKTTGKALFLKRGDKELRLDDTGLEENFPKPDDKVLEIKDWPGMDLPPNELKANKRKVRWNKHFTRLKLFLSKDGRHVNAAFGQFPIYESHLQLQKGIDFINQYDRIYSTRLHGVILSLLLDKEVFVFDNSYGKNSNFYHTWLKDFDICTMIE